MTNHRPKIEETWKYRESHFTAAETHEWKLPWWSKPRKKVGTVFDKVLDAQWDYLWALKLQGAPVLERIPQYLPPGAQPDAYSKYKSLILLLSGRREK